MSANALQNIAKIEDRLWDAADRHVGVAPAEVDEKFEEPGI